MEVVDIEKAQSIPSESGCLLQEVADVDAVAQESAEKNRITQVPTHTSCASRNKTSNLLSDLAKTITARSCASIIDPGPPPDGGARAWLQAFMGHFVVFNTWGMISCFGVFQQYYTHTLGLEPSAVSWIGTLQMLGHFSLGMFTGRLLDAGLFHWCIIPGMLLSALSLFMTSLCTQYWQLFLAQGILNGIGNGFQFVPSASLIATYFSKNRTVAICIMAAGSGTGGLVYPTIARQLLPRIGFAWTTRVMGFIMLAVGAMYSFFLRPRLPPRKSGPLFELSAFREPVYMLFCIGTFLVGLGSFMVFYYLPSYATNILGLPYSTSISILLLLNGMGIIGRLTPSYFADKYTGPYNLLIPSCIFASILLFFWPLFNSSSKLYAFSAIFGYFIAGFQGLFPAVLATLTKDLNKMGTRNGQGMAFIGVGVFVGPPVAGALVQTDGGKYLNAQVFAGSSVLLGCIVLIAGRLCHTGLVFKARA